MNTILVIGAPGMGKSPFVKQQIEGKRCLVFDVANEYGERVKYKDLKPLRLSDNNKDIRSRYTGTDLKLFVQMCEGKKDTVCIFEEATGFMQGQLFLPVTRLIIGRLHTGNTYIFVFHSINSVPPRILEMSNYVCLFKTNDTYMNVARKAGILLPYFQDLQNQKQGEKHLIKII